MNRFKKWGHRLRLPLMFAFIVFLIFAMTFALVLLLAVILSHFGLVTTMDIPHFPLLILALICLLIGSILSMLFSRLPLAPYREIMSAVDRIADGDYSVRLHLRGPEEFRALTKKFNHMAEELGSVEMLRSDFVNNFSHEFKTPIVSIRGFAKALKWEDLSEEERSEYLNIIISEAERLTDLSTNVLYLSKIEQQTILTDKHPFNLSEQIRRVIVLLDQKLTQKHLQVDLRCSEISCTGNEEMLRQVWINLLDNAIKFSPEYDQIELCIMQTEEQIRVSISNQGLPIPEETAAHLFDKFYQGDPSHTSHGNGLGLAIAKRIVTLHEGSITFHQSADGLLTFEVSLP